MIVNKEIEYFDGDLRCRGLLAWNDTWDTPKPAVMVAHDWGGRGKTACAKAMQLAELGYAGFAIDMYGNAELGRDKTHKQSLITPLVQNRPQLAARIIKAFQALAQLPQVDEQRIAAIGYCFGGLCVLDLARSGVNIKGVVSFHGLLFAPANAPTTPLESQILILHGFDDPLVPVEQLIGFTKEMSLRKADWQIHMYGLTAHSFTDPTANDDEMGLHYNQKADERSWQTATQFLASLLQS